MTGVHATVLVEIGALRVTASSAIDARRLADALPAALARALRAWPVPPAVPPTRRVGDLTTRGADHAAAEVVRSVLARVEGEGRAG
jgi:hypothetical protein